MTPTRLLPSLKGTSAHVSVAGTLLPMQDAVRLLSAAGGSVASYGRSRGRDHSGDAVARGSIRAKTAEAFTFPTDIPIPAGTEAIQLQWTAPQDPRSAMVVSLRYASSQNPGILSRNVLCTFMDDGVDSIPFRWHQNWSTSTGVRAVVATRLRTNYVGVGEANLGVISTYQVPTPPNP